jgi:hypothetical protein
MTYWNMRAYSDGGEMHLKARRAETDGRTQAQQGRRGRGGGGNDGTGSRGTGMPADVSRATGEGR